MDFDAFRYESGELVCEGLTLREIAATVGTPTYVYSQASLLARAGAFLSAAPVDSLICFAVKANGNPHLLRLLAESGMGADVTSGGELFLALHAGFRPERILFSGVGKTETELCQAMDANIHAIHVESEQEFRLIEKLASRRQQVIALAVRLNPGVAASTHDHMRTGEPQHKFGVPPDTALQLLWEAAEHPWLRPVGLAVHIGSQITQLEPFLNAAQRAVALAGAFSERGGALDYLDIGGGLGISYDGAPAPAPASWVKSVAQPIQEAGLRLVAEPGRSIIAPAGLLLTRVLYTKQQGGRRFVIVDAGMNSLLRPTLYDAYHPIKPVMKPRLEQVELTDVVGPICETGDFLARQRPLPPLQQGDLLAVTQAGAYGYAMSSNYNGQLRPAELLVDGNETRIIRARETYGDLLRGA